MSAGQRIRFLADGSIVQETASVFRGNDEVATKTITKQIVVRDDGGTGSHEAPVHIDPDNDQGPLVIHYDSSANQQGLSVVDETNDDEVFRIEESGLVVATKSLQVDGSVGGTAFDLGDWTRQTSSAQGPTTNTAITRNSGTETVHVSNLRVTTKTTDPKTYVSNVLVSDPSGAYAGDGIERGLFFEAGQFEEALRALPPLAVDKAGAYLIAQSADDERIYRFGFDPEKNENDDGLHFTDTRGSGIRQIQLIWGPATNPSQWVPSTAQTTLLRSARVPRQSTVTGATLGVQR